MLYGLVKILLQVVLLLLRGWKVKGAENIPASGAAVVVANHVSYWDPIAVICAFKRKVHFMAKSELFKIPLVGQVVKLSGAFPVSRGKSDRQTVKTARNLLASGELVGVFPEGTRSHTGQLLKPHLGAAMLALHAGVPVLPVAVKGSRGVIGKVIVNIGKPIPPAHTGVKAGKKELEEMSDRIMTIIGDLLAQAGR